MNPINSSFNRLASLNFIAQTERIVTALTGNAHFAEPWPAAVPTLAQIQTDLTAFQGLVNATAAGDKTRIVEREAARDKLQAELTLLAFYLQTTAQGDATILVTTGYPLRQPRVQARITVPPPAPELLALVHGALSGTLLARARPVPKAASYDAQVTSADPTVEANWTLAGSFKNSSRIELQGLTPGKIYSVRLRALGSAGPGAWTPASSLMVM